MKNKKEVPYQSQFSDIDLSNSEIDMKETAFEQAHQCNLCGAIISDENTEGSIVDRKTFICSGCVSKWNRLTWWQRESVRLNPDYIGIRDYRTPGAMVLTIFFGIMAGIVGVLIVTGLLVLLSLITQPDSDSLFYRALIGSYLGGASGAFLGMYQLTSSYIKKVSFLFYCEDNNIPIKRPTRK